MCVILKGYLMTLTTDPIATITMNTIKSKTTYREPYFPTFYQLCSPTCSFIPLFLYLHEETFTG